VRAIGDFENLYLHRQPVDLRKNIYGLSALVQNEMALDLKSRSLFIFCNERRTLIKILYFDHSGFALWLKKLEESKFPWPKDFEDQVVKVSAADLEMMLSGINVWSKFKEVHFEQVV
jgi:transposase